MTRDDGADSGARLDASAGKSRGASSSHANKGQLATVNDVGSDLDQRATTEVDTPRQKQNLEAPWTKVKLISELARGTKTQQQLATEYGVGRSAVSMFKQRHLTAIEIKRENLAAEFDDLWIASKAQRLATLQEAAERLAAKPDARSAEVLAKLLKDAAEELGDLPTRAGVQINTANVTYEVVGIDTSQLM